MSSGVRCGLELVGGLELGLVLEEPDREVRGAVSKRSADEVTVMI